MRAPLITYIYIHVASITNIYICDIKDEGLIFDIHIYIYTC